jgi:Rrf2 family protein
MRITYKGDYALKTILDLALHYGKGPVTIHDLAKRADIPIKFLEQILLNLKRGGFVQSRRGKIGGYFLARSPAAIKLGEVIRFIDGPVEPVTCIAKNYRGCNDIGKCVFRDIWAEISERTASIIDNINFEDLVKKTNRLDRSICYHI